VGTFEVESKILILIAQKWRFKVSRRQFFTSVAGIHFRSGLKIDQRLCSYSRGLSSNVKLTGSG
jgi:hypothetical protein